MKRYCPHCGQQLLYYSHYCICRECDAVWDKDKFDNGILNEIIERIYTPEKILEVQEESQKNKKKAQEYFKGK